LITKAILCSVHTILHLTKVAMVRYNTVHTILHLPTEVKQKTILHFIIEVMQYWDTPYRTFLQKTN
jgi:hypothetical protein